MTPVEPGIENDHYSRIVAKTAEQHQLFSVHWDLTYRCNLRCTHCYVVKPGDPGFKAPGPELSTEECKSIIDQLADENVLNIGFSGGEIFLRHDFFEIARYARRKRFAVRLLTNGTLITPEVADEIATLHPVWVSMSVHGARAETHDGITQVTGSFEQVIRAFRLLSERGIKTYLKTSLMRENVGELDDIRTLAEKVGAIFRYSVTITPKDDGCPLPLRHRLSDDELLCFFRQELTSDWKPRRLKEDEPVCLSGLNMISIDPYGIVYPCVQLKMRAGNLRRQPLRTIWRESPVLQRMRNLTLADFTTCSMCDLREFCIWCPGLALVEDGDLLGPSSAACRQALLRRQVLKEKELV